MRSVNVDGVRVVLAACRDAGVRRVVHVSSIHAFSALPVDGASTNRAVPPSRTHRRTIAARQPARSSCAKRSRRGLDVVIVNPTAIVGPYDFRPSRMGEVMLDLYHRRMAGLVAGGFDWVDVRDVAASVIAAADRGGAGL